MLYMTGANTTHRNTYHVRLDGHGIGLYGRMDGVQVYHSHGIQPFFLAVPFTRAWGKGIE